MPLYLLTFSDTSADNGYRQFLVTEDSLKLAKRALSRRCNKPDYPVSEKHIRGEMVQLGPKGTIQEVT